MKKFTLAAFTIMAIGLTGCPSDKAEPLPDVKSPAELTVPAGTRLLNIECGQPCVLYVDDETGTFYAKMLDGTLLKVTQAEDE